MLVRIEIAGPGAKARRLVFDDGGAPRETSAAAVKRLGIEEGTEVAREAVVAALSETEYGLAKERALRLLGYREHSAEELLRKLRDTGYPEAVAQAVVARFTERCGRLRASADPAGTGDARSLAGDHPQCAQ